MENNRKDVCCPEFNPALWDEKTHVWQDKLFLRANVKQLFHMPLNMSKVITKMCAQMEAAKAYPDNQDFLMMFYDPSPWKSEMYITSTKEIDGVPAVRLSGTFITKVFDGPYQAIPKFYKEMEKYASGLGKKIKKQYFHYAYCPKCSKKYGHNYIVAVAEIE